MDRRTFIATASATALAGPATQAAAAVSGIGAARDLVLASPYPAATTGPGDDAYRIASTLARITGRRVRIEASKAACSSIACLETGGADFVFAPEQNNLAHAPALGALAGVAGRDGIDPAMIADWLASPGGEALLDACHAPFASKPLFAGFEGMGATLWSRTPLEGGLAGRRIAAAGLGAETLKGIGAIPAAVAPEDLARALEASEIDGALVAGIEAALALDLHRVARWCSDAAPVQGASVLTLAFRRPLWETFGDNTQDSIRAALTLDVHRRLRAILRNELALRNAIAASSGVTFHQLDSKENAALLRVREAVAADFSTRSPLARRVHGAAVTHALVIEKSDCGLSRGLNAV